MKRVEKQSHAMDEPRSPRDYLYLLATGFTMGSADVVPGVSGGTMAFIMGVYQELVGAIRNVDQVLLRMLFRGELRAAMKRIRLPFLAALGLGIATALLSFAGIITRLLAEHPERLFAFFFGLVLASILMVGSHVHWNAWRVIALLVGGGIAYWIVGLVPLEMSHGPLVLFGSGAVAIMAMILPGVSGSFILLVLGQYEHVLTAVKNMDLLGLIPLAAGMIVGITSFARFLNWLLKRYGQMTIAVLTGFMLGSLRRIWPFKITIETRIDHHGDVIPVERLNRLPDVQSAEFIWAMALCVLGCLLILGVAWIRARMERSHGGDEG